MLDIARERATASGLTNVEFIEADAERLDFPDGSFDSVLWRWGLTSVPNPSTTLVAIRRMLTPGGSFATSVWESAPKARPLASAAAAVARQMFDLPSPQADESSLSGSAAGRLEQQMMDAGFCGIRVEKMTLTLPFSSSEECTQYLIDVSPELAALLSDKPAARQAEFRQRVAEKLRQYATDDGSVRIPNVTLCAVGRR
jgi:HAMP domain-containing protein